MENALVKIKRAVLAGKYAFSEKARVEMREDGLEEMDVVESIMNAVAIWKTLRSTSALRSHSKERLYVIQSVNMDGLPIYTKGKWVGESHNETFYFLISSKRAS